jgi:hypothetical protein
VHCTWHGCQQYRGSALLFNPSINPSIIVTSVAISFIEKLCQPLTENHLFGAVLLATLQSIQLAMSTPRHHKHALYPGFVKHATHLDAFNQPEEAVTPCTF